MKTASTRTPCHSASRLPTTTCSLCRECRHGPLEVQAQGDSRGGWRAPHGKASVRLPEDLTAVFRIGHVVTVYRDGVEPGGVGPLGAQAGLSRHWKAALCDRLSKPWIEIRHDGQVVTNEPAFRQRLAANPPRYLAGGEITHV